MKHQRRIVSAVRICKRRQYHNTSILCSSNNSNYTNNDDDPLTNGGTVVGVWIFHRHGDRAPNRYLGNPQYIQNEADHWYSRIPHNANSPPGGEEHESLSQYFPPDIHPNQNGGRYLDVDRVPFGFLTYRGMDQMREGKLGAALFVVLTYMMHINLYSLLLYNIPSGEEV